MKENKKAMKKEARLEGESLSKEMKEAKGKADKKEDASEMKCQRSQRKFH